MKKLYIFIASLLLCACSAEQAEEFAFRKTAENDLIKMCSSEGKDESCEQSVKDQIKSCMVKSNWRKYLEAEDDEKEMMRFVTSFYPCFKDKNGNSYF